MASLFFPVLGVILSNALYFSSTPAIVQASRRGTLGSLNPLPLSLMVVSTVSWMCYALAVPNGFIVASNLPGAVAAFAFVAIVLPLIPTENTATRRSVTLVLAGGAAGLLTLWTYLVFAKVAHDRLVFLLGAFASGICILLFASPLSTVREVVATSNAASIYGPLTATQCTNCAMWTVYGIGIGDIWVYGPNGAGLTLGLAQLLLKLLYPSIEPRMRKDSPSDDDAASDTASDVVLLSSCA